MINFDTTNYHAFEKNDPLARPASILMTMLYVPHEGDLSVCDGQSIEKFMSNGSLYCVRHET
jgi:hypothetical protein